MSKNEMGGLIPCMIAEGIKECDAYTKEPHLDYYVADAIYKK
jgi:hypothetical protein